MIEDIASEIDTALSSAGVITPITAAMSASFFRWVEKVNIDGAAAAVLTVRYADDRGINSNTAAARWTRQYEAAMSKIWSGDAIPDGLTLTAGNLPTSYAVEYKDENFEQGDVQGTSFPSDLEL